MHRMWTLLAAGALGAGPSPASAQEAGSFAGQWQSASEDGTELHAAELTATGGRVTGRVVRAERGYFSGNVEVKEQLDFDGAVRGGVLEFTGRLQDAEGRDAAAAGSAIRRGDYLVIRLGTYEVALAPPGVPLVVAAEGSAEAAALLSRVMGREYSTASQAQGRGAFVGERVRLALCSDGTVAYSRSDLVAVPGAVPGAGVDGGSSWSRRGTWRLVLYAGAPTVRADWEGTGTTYTLVDYIRIEPASDGGSAVVDGRHLPVTGRC